MTSLQIHSTTNPASKRWIDSDDDDHMPKHEQYHGAKRMCGRSNADLLSNAPDSDGFARTTRPTPSARASLRSVIPMLSEGALILLLLLLDTRHDGEKPKASPTMASAARDAAVTAGECVVSSRPCRVCCVSASLTSDHVYNPQSKFDQSDSLPSSQMMLTIHDHRDILLNQKRGWSDRQVIVTLCLLSSRRQARCADLALVLSAG